MGKKVIYVTLNMSLVVGARHASLSVSATISRVYRKGSEKKQNIP